MATKNMLIAIVAVAVVLVAAAAVIVTYGSDDKPEDAAINGLKGQLSVGDYYSIAQGEASFDNTTTYRVAEVDGSNLTVEIESSDGGIKTAPMTVSDYYAPIYYDIGDTNGLETATISTPWGDKVCWLYNDSGDSGATSFNTTDWIGVDDSIVYMSWITYTPAGGEPTMITQRLSEANVVIGGGSGSSTPAKPDAPSAGGALRTDLVSGDRIEFTVTEDRRTSVETYEVISVDGNRVTYREVDDDGDVDVETTTVNGFLREMVLSDTSRMSYIDTVDLQTAGFGTVRCDIYRLYDDRDEYEDYYIGPDNVIYKMEEYDDGRLDKTVTLTSTTLFGSGSGTVPVEPVPPSNSYGIELSVGDSYTILSEERGERGETETYTVIAVNGNRVTVEERDDRGRTEVETTTADRFLREVFALPSTLQILTSSGTETIDGIQCVVYSYIDGDETETLYVHADTGLIVRERSDEADGDWEQDTVTAIVIASLQGLPF